MADRRTWLCQTAGLAGAGLRGLGGLGFSGVAALSGCANLPASGLARLPSPSPGTDTDGAYRLANRLSWGANDTELARLARLGSAGYVQAQLQPEGPDGLPAEVQAQIDTLRIQRQTPADLLVALDAQRKAADALPAEAARLAAQQAHQKALNDLAREAAHRHLWRAVHGQHQLREQLVWFWLNHFSVFQYKGQVRALLGDYEERAIRPRVLGHFRDLLGAVALHPAMLVYLDNPQNSANRINENYARELLELHTLGVDGGYSQRDVQELARVLTGHGTHSGNPADPPPKLKPEWQPLYQREGVWEFNPARHDFGAKQVLGAPVASRGAPEVAEVLNRLAAHPATARFVSGRLAHFLLGEPPPPALAQSLVQAWQRSGGHIATVVAALVAAPEFLATRPQRVKDPMRFVVSAVRAAYDGAPVLNAQPMAQWLNRLGQGLYNRQTPDGYPLAAEAWTGTGQMAARFEVARAIGSSASGLFKPGETAVALRERPGFPQLARLLYYQHMQRLMGDGTRAALAQAASPQDWNTLYLSAPEFMHR